MPEDSADAPHVWTYLSTSEAATVGLGSAMADLLQPGTVVALIGHLGAGKTRLVQAVATAAGVDRREVSSPTFVLVQEYEGRWPIYHFDVYRLGGVEEFLDLGAEEYLHGAGVCFIEWADRLSDYLRPDLTLTITATGEFERSFRFEAGSARGAGLVEALARQF